MEYNVIIAGGGLAGLTSAIHLSRVGFKVLIIEKNAFPRHKVCGEYLSREVEPYLEWLGIDLSLKKPEVLDRLQVSAINGHSVESRLQLGGIGLSRFVLDKILLDKALSQGCSLLQDTVTGFSQQGGECKVSTGHHGVFRASRVLGAFGRHSQLDHTLDRRPLQQSAGWMGVKGHYTGEFPSGLVGIHHFEGGYCGVSRIEEQLINICYLTTYLSFRRYKSIPVFQTQVLSQNPWLKQIFAECRPVFAQPLAVGQISFEGREQTASGALMLGDAAGMIHPFCGNGMAIAIHTGKIAAELLVEDRQNNMGLKQLNLQYIRSWNLHFNRRIHTGRFWASIIRSRTGSAVLLSALTCLPSLLPVLIRQTHGQTLEIPLC